MITALIEAALKGPAEEPLCLVEVDGSCLLRFSPGAIDEDNRIEHVVQILPKKYIPGGKIHREGNMTAAAGGINRSDSIHRGLLACPKETSKVIIHDANRPVPVTQKQLDDLFNGIKDSSAVISLVKSDDSILYFPKGGIKKLIDRNEAFVSQTPQMYSYSKLMEAYDTCEVRGFIPEDPMEVWANVYGYDDIVVIPGITGNSPVKSEKQLRSIMPRLMEPQPVDMEGFIFFEEIKTA